MNSKYRKSLPGTDLEYFDTREAVEALKPGAWEPGALGLGFSSVLGPCGLGLVFRSWALALKYCVLAFSSEVSGFS